MVALIPQVAKQNCFALKGGTAINFFIRDMPRLSVDIDLAYLPVEDRQTSLTNIDKALAAIATTIEQRIAEASVRASSLKETGSRYKLIVWHREISVKIEVTPVLRGSVYPAEIGELSARARAAFGFARMQLLSFEDLYAGKLCAALDRQHPRDLYDVKLLLDNEGISKRMKNAFLVYLMGHNRPMAELLDPMPQEIGPLFRAEFGGMTHEPVSLGQLEKTFKKMVRKIHTVITDEDRNFLMALKRGTPDWQTFALPEAERLPAIQWKILNLNRMNPNKRKKAVAKLEKVLFR